MTQRKLIYLIRHGETNYNKQGIVQGSGVDTPLNQKGQEQAAQFYEFYKQEGFEVVFTSPLIRTIQSVARFIHSGLPHLVLPEIREISWGHLEGLQQEPAHQLEFYEVQNQWQQGNFLAAVKGGENALTLQNRLLIGAQKISNYNANKILVCMHGRAMKALLCALLNEPLTNMESFKHSNLCLYTLCFENGKYELLEANSTLHLQQL